MKITQHDVARIDTATLKRLAVFYDELARSAEMAPGLRQFCAVLAAALVGVVRERHSGELLLETELMSDDGPGAIVEADSDPVADALRELRGECP